jgi:hypothetical protein
MSTIHRDTSTKHLAACVVAHFTGKERDAESGLDNFGAGCPRSRGFRDLGAGRSCCWGTGRACPPLGKDGIVQPFAVEVGDMLHEGRDQRMWFRLG